MEDMRFATLRLGKTSVDEIKRMDKSSPGIVATDFNISVKMHTGSARSQFWNLCVYLVGFRQ